MPSTRLPALAWFAAWLLAFAAVPARAQSADAPAAEASPYSAHVTLISEYRYRGISQSARQPALHAGFDYAPASGFYLGAWGSTIRWIQDSAPGLKGPLEVDIYGGYKGSLASLGGLGYDVGLLQYGYPTNNYSQIGANANTTEAYGALSYGPATVKYSHSLTDLFGTPNSRNSGYLDVSATFDLGHGFSVSPHLGRQVVKRAYAYTDYGLAVAKEWSGFVFTANLVGTTFKRSYGVPYTLAGSGNRDLAGTALVVSVKKVF